MLAQNPKISYRQMSKIVFFAWFCFQFVVLMLIWPGLIFGGEIRAYCGVLQPIGGTAVGPVA